MEYVLLTVLLKCFLLLVALIGLVVWLYRTL
jgi:hypothetical protein